MKTIFWNVDTQYDFMRNDKSFKGALPVQDARGIEVNLETLTKFANEKNLKVVNTADWHTMDSTEFSNNPDYIATFPEHCLIGTKGARFVPATRPKNPYVIDWRAADIDTEKIEQVRNIVLYKDAFDIFTGNKYANQVVEQLNPDRAIVYGVATNVCVDYAVTGLRDRGVEVYVPLDAIKELPTLPLEATLDKWRIGKNQVKFIQTGDISRILGDKK